MTLSKYIQLRVRRAALGACAAVGFVLSACGSSSSDSDFGGGGGASGTAGAPGNNARGIAFTPNDTLTLTPGEQRTVAVTVTPPDRYRVRFALLGDSGNASLDSGEVDTDGSGRAEVTLSAPSTSSAFTLRANVGSVSAKLPVAVSESGFVTLRVAPEYAGNRPVSVWTASVHTGTSCAALSGNPPPDGDLVAEALAGTDPQIERVPVGPPLAVTLRAEQFVGGCADVPSLDSSSVTSVSVPVTDRPLQLGDTDLVVSFGIDDSSAWREAVDAGVASFVNAFRGNSDDDAAALLDAMAAGAGIIPGTSAFESARQIGDWDAEISSLWSAALGDDVLSSSIASWLETGAESLRAPDGVVARLHGAQPMLSGARLDVLTVGGAEPGAAGFAQTIAGEDVTWFAEPGDTVHLGAVLRFAHTELLAELARPAALDDVSEATTIPEALAVRADCPGIAAQLDGGTALVGCDGACLETLCRDALVSLWEAAAKAAAGNWQVASLSISAAGDATVDGEANPTSFEGKWVGTLSWPASEPVTLGGPADGVPNDPTSGPE